MVPTARTLIVIPTGGCERSNHGHLVPNHLGVFRLEKLAELLEADADALAAISGGKRANPVGGEALIHYHFFAAKWPHLASRVIIVDASSIYTAGDMAALADRIVEWERANRDTGRFATIVMVSHPNHAHLAILSLNAGFPIKGDRSFRVEESGEPACRSRGQQLVLNWTTRRDPHWKKWFSWPLRFVAARDKRHV